MMKRAFAILAIIGLMGMVSCGPGKDTRTSAIQNFSELKQAVKERQFEIENDWALPLGGDRVDLFSNPNFIRFKNDSVNIFLPYFGVRHTVSNYGDEGGIKYEGVAGELDIQQDEAKNKIALEFEIENGTENLDFQITLFANGNTNTSVVSSQRSSISYQGKVREIQPQDKRQETN